VTAGPDRRATIVVRPSRTCRADRGLRVAACLVCFSIAAVATAAPVAIEPTPAALVQAMQRHRVVLLGEVHDNAAQHALRAAALRQWIVAGARPAIAFEQFDRDRQPDIERARRERPRDADYLIAQAKGESDWNWEEYRPFVALALEYDLPIIGANLSRRDAMRVAIDGWAAVFDAAARDELKLDALPANFRRSHDDEIAAGHCNLLDPEALPTLARAQIARDIVMARSIRPYVTRGAVLLAGNGHVRRDIGVPFWLPADARRGAISIGVLERSDDGSLPESAANFDAYLITKRAERTDPCKGLAQRLHNPR
jgi:uncharacterized iron-regulated protein